MYYYYCGQLTMFGYVQPYDIITRNSYVIYIQYNYAKGYLTELNAIESIYWLFDRQLHYVIICGHKNDLFYTATLIVL